MQLPLVVLLHVHVHAHHLRRTFLGLSITHYIMCVWHPTAISKFGYKFLNTDLHVFNSNNVTQSDRMQCSIVTYCFDSCAHFLRPQKIHHACQVSEVCNIQPGIC